MSLVVPDVGKVNFLNLILNQTLTLKLFSNNVVPDETFTNASLNVVSGGGYANKNLSFGDWDIDADGIATYSVAQDFTFTGTTGAPGTIYGYYIINASNILIIAERFPETVLPFSPGNGSLIRVTPRLQVG